MSAGGRRETDAALREQVGRLARQQQELIATRDRLDREVSRFEQMQEFYSSAIALDDETDLVAISMEVVCEIFELEFAALIAVDWPGHPVGAVVGAHGEVGDLLDLSALHKVRSALQGHPRQASVWRAGEAVALLGPGVEQVAASSCTVTDGGELAVLVAGVRPSGSPFYPPIESAHLSSFSLLAQQIGSLVQALGHRARIESQMEQLALEQQRLRLALDGSAAGEWEWDVEARRLYYSPRCKSMLGYPDAEVSDSVAEWESRIHPDDLAMCRDRVGAALEGGSGEYLNIHRLRHRNGEYLWIMSRGTVLRAADGRPRRLVGINIDVTEMHQARERAEAASRAKSEFLATVSHEIRTPLNGVTGVLQLLADSPLTGDQRGQVAVGLDSADQLMRVINGVLDLSRLESGQVQFERRPFSPVDELVDAAELLRGPLAAKALTLDVFVADGMPDVVVGDSLRLRQIVTNLVGNALKFTDSGRVELAVGGAPRADGYELRFSVSDTGIGIAAEALPTLFDAFVQADASTSRRFGGSGLGLAICRRMLDAMGGRIGVTSAQGIGSRFDVRVPVGLPGEPAEAVAQESPPQTVSAGCRTLLVEDNAVNQMVAKSMLERLGCHVVVVDSGAGALSAAAEQAFDLVFMDVHMPGMDGLETTRRLRRSGAGRVPVIALTANVLEHTRRDCAAAGMDDFVAKPVSKAALAGAVARWAPGGGTQCSHPA